MWLNIDTAWEKEEQSSREDNHRGNMRYDERRERRRKETEGREIEREKERERYDATSTHTFHGIGDAGTID